jgi:multidrug efflux pump subunit AcrB
VAGPLLIALLCVLAVFVPSLFMQGAARALFVPLTLAVGFAMIASWLLDRTLVPILAVWWLRQEDMVHEGGPMEPIRRRYQALQARVATWSAGMLVTAYAAVALVVVAAGALTLGTEIFPEADAGQLQLRLRAPTGTRLDVTEEMTKKALAVITQDAGNNGVADSLALVGVHGSAYPINFIHQWTSGPQEAVLQVQLTATPAGGMSAFRDRLRADLARAMPHVRFSFEPADIVSRVMSFGASTPIEVAVMGKSLDDNRAFAEKIRSAMAGIKPLRDVQIAQPLDYPAVKVTMDRDLAGLAGVTSESLSRSLTPYTSSSRFTQPVYWAANTGIAYQVQVQGTQPKSPTLEDMRNLPVSAVGNSPLLLRNVASVAQGTVPGEYDRYNGLRVVSVTANFEGAALGPVAADVQAAINALGPRPRASASCCAGRSSRCMTFSPTCNSGLAWLCWPLRCC